MSEVSTSRGARSSGRFSGFAVYQLLVTVVPCAAWIWLIDVVHQFFLDEPSIDPDHAGWWTAVFAVSSLMMIAIPMAICWLVGSVIAAMVIAMKPGRIGSIVKGFVLGVITLLVEAGVLFLVYVL